VGFHFINVVRGALCLRYGQGSQDGRSRSSCL
ncbi:uncharacterized protein METZ01_LOCUS451074, partial [marine metagenome]